MSTPTASMDRKIFAILAIGFLLGLPGCSPKAEIVLQQPFAPPSQQHLKLAGNWAFQAAAEDRRAWLLAFPLPSTPDGPRDFNLYVSTPDGISSYVLDQSSPDGARAFLIQEVGELRGKTVFTGGQIRVSKPWFAPRRYVIDLNLASSDGTVVIGRATVEPLANEVTAFERRYSGDVMALTPREEARDLAADRAAEHTRATP